MYTLISILMMIIGFLTWFQSMHISRGLKNKNYFEEMGSITKALFFFPNKERWNLMLKTYNNPSKRTLTIYTAVFIFLIGLLSLVFL